MATNIAKLQAQLQRVPDQALIGYVQNPDGQVPSYLALAELQRRKEIRQASAPKQAMPTQTVAQQVMAQADPGVASLPVRDDMFQEESMAAGGIVAFGRGGDTSEYVPSMLRTPDPSLWERAKQYYRDLNAQKYGYIDRDMLPSWAQAFTPAGGYVPTVADKAPMTPAQAAATKAAVEQAPPAEVVPAKTPPAAPVKPTRTGIGSVGYKDLQFKPVSIDEAGYAAAMPSDQSMRDYAEEFKAELGEDAGRAALKAKIAQMEAKGAKEAEQAPWMALAKAGLGMAAGKSQFAMQNIAAGGIEGLKDYAEAKDRLAKAEERRFDMESRVAQAERAEQLAAINYGADSKRADDKARQTVTLQKQADKARANEVNAKGQYDAVKDKYGFEQKDREIDLMDKRIREQIDKTEVQSQRYELQNQREYYKSILDKLADRIKTEQGAVSPDATTLKNLQRQFDATYNAMAALAASGGKPGAAAPANRRPLGTFDLK
jgi:hypothetical protein